MTAPSRPEDDPLVEFAVRRFAPPGADPDPCPGENLWASYADGVFLAGEREGFEAHLRRCGRCRDLSEVASRGRKALAAPTAGRVLRIPLPAWLGGGRAARSHGRRGIEVRSWVAAAALLGAVAAALIGSGVLRRSDTSGTVAGSETERALVASAADLARARPELFGDFLPYSARERRAAGPPLRGGAPAPVYPAGKILEARPAFRWEAGPAPQEDEIVLRTARGDLVWRGRGRAPLLEYPADAPDLQPGVRYVWEIASGGRRVFATASAEERRAFESWRKEIEARVSAPLRTLVLAHLALRREFVGEAERAALAFVASAPGEAVGKETLDLVLQRLGVLGSTGPETRGPGPR